MEKVSKITETHPVIFLSFSNAKGTNFKAIRMIIIRKLVKLYSPFLFVKNCKWLNEKDIAYFDTDIEIMPDDITKKGIH